MPHRVNQWNFTDRGSSTCHNDIYRGRSNGTYQASNMKMNQGFASVMTTFPQGAFMTCRYPAKPNGEGQRTEENNTWHPKFPGVAEDPAVMPKVPYNTTGTKPLPIPFNKRPGYEEEERKAAELAHQKYLAFKALRITSTSGDIIPPDYHDHTIYSAEHARTEHQPGQIFRKSKERVGTTPAERAVATKKLADQQAEVAQVGRATEQQLRREEEASFYPSNSGPSRVYRSNGQEPVYKYNIPIRTATGVAYPQRP